MPTIAVAFDEALRTSDALIYFRLDDGRGAMLDRLRREPARARVNRTDDNLFQAIGRGREHPAVPGELLGLPLRGRSGKTEHLLLVETSTGYVAYFEKITKNRPLGTIRTTLGRPFEDLAEGDGRFILVGRRGGNGRTDDALLYHASSGRARLLREVFEMPLEPEIQTVSGLPRLEGEVAATAIDGANGRTLAYLFVDGAEGALHQATVAATGEVSGVRRLSLALFDVFPQATPAPASPRFVTVPINRDDGATTRVLVIDIGSGTLGWLGNVDQGTPTLTALDLDLTRFLTAPGAPAVRSLEAVPRFFGGSDTLGAWLVDGRARQILYLDGFSDPRALRIAPVDLTR